MAFARVRITVEMTKEYEYPAANPDQFAAQMDNHPEDWADDLADYATIEILDGEYAKEEEEEVEDDKTS